MVELEENSHIKEPLDYYGDKANYLNEIEDFEAKISKRKLWSYLWGGVFIGSIIIPILNNLLKLEINMSLGFIILNILVFLLSSVGLIYVVEQDKTDEKNRRDRLIKLQSIENLIFSHEISNATQEERAVKQLNKSQQDLDKYYQLNISHINKIFKLGKTIILLGTFVIVITIILMFFKPRTVNDITLIFSLIGGVLVDFIGAIFISMYSKTIKSANLSQYGMLETTQAYLGNVLASQIQDEKLREETLSNLAKSLIEKEKKINFNE